MRKDLVLVMIRDNENIGFCTTDRREFEALKNDVILDQYDYWKAIDIWQLLHYHGKKLVIADKFDIAKLERKARK